MKIALKLSYDYIQEIRLAHAVSESDYELCIPEKDKLKFEKLIRYFHMKYTLTDEKVNIIDDIKIVHREVSPLTSIGKLERPLIFPKSILEYTKSTWPKKRKIDFGFIGLITDPRKKWISEYLANTIKGYKNYTGKLKIDIKLNDFLYKIGLRNANVIVTASLKGRDFPNKSWDEDYYSYMAASKFALCPSGDDGCPWSYRFFEAMLCGVIPVVEAVSPSYEPFKYYTAETPIEKLVWNEDIANYNYEQCLKHLTLPKDELNKELKRLVEK